MSRNLSPVLHTCARLHSVTNPYLHLRTTIRTCHVNIQLKRKSTSAKQKSYNVSDIIRWKVDNNRLFGPIVHGDDKTKGQDAKGDNSQMITEDEIIKTQTQKLKTKINLEANAIESLNTNVELETTAVYQEKTQHSLIQRSGSINNSLQSEDLFISPDSHSDAVNVSDSPSDMPISRLKDGQVPADSHNGISSVLTKCTAAGFTTTKLDLIFKLSLYGGGLSTEEADILAEELSSSPRSSAPSVMAILNKTRSAQSELLLKRWQEKMIAELGEEGFQKYQQGMLNRGINFHACVQQFLESYDEFSLQLQPENQGHWKSIRGVLDNVQSVESMEERIAHPHLGYTGRYDCIATYRDVLYLIDWKTSEKPKPFLTSLYDNPLQAAAYLGAVNSQRKDSNKITNALIVVAYTGGNAAHVHRISQKKCEHYWTLWLHRLHHYWKNTLDK